MSRVVVYRIEGRIPGRSKLPEPEQWMTLGALGRIDTLEEARELLALARRTRGRHNVRLIRATEEIIE